MLIERVLVQPARERRQVHAGRQPIAIAARAAGRDLRRDRSSDHGPGLPPGREEAIFEKFTRGESEIGDAGVGLGLAICRAIVEAHGGRHLGRDGAAEGGGARFCFTLPLGDAAGDARRRRGRAGAHAANAVMSDDRRPRSLIVEDEPQIRRFVRLALEAEGWQVLEADTVQARA